MKRRRLTLIAVTAIVLFIAGCMQPETDLQLTRHIFNSLCKGDRSAQELIDWGTFKAMGQDVGKAFSNIVLERDRKDYIKAFFYNFSYSFKAARGRESGFFNWRVKERGADKTVVAADTPMGKVILFTLSIENGKRKLTAIDWQS